MNLPQRNPGFWKTWSVRWPTLLSPFRIIQKPAGLLFAAQSRFFGNFHILKINNLLGNESSGFFFNDLLHLRKFFPGSVHFQRSPRILRLPPHLLPPVFQMIQDIFPVLRIIGKISGSIFQDRFLIQIFVRYPSVKYPYFLLSIPVVP